MKKALAIVLTLVMLFALCVPALATGGATLVKVDNKVDKSTLRGFKSESFTKNNTYRYADDETVRAIITLSGVSAAKAGELGSSQAADAVAGSKRQQASVQNRMTAQNIPYRVMFTYSTLLSGMSVEVAYGDLDAIAAIPGVDAVYIANRYSVPDTTADDGMLAAGTADTNKTRLRLTGGQTIIAILDTGFNVTHDVFSPDTLDEMISDGFMTSFDERFRGRASVDGAYISSKIPFAYDYADGDDDVTDTNGHGTHVAGIATGLSTDENGSINFAGGAPLAQLLAMKVFPDNSESTSSDIYFAALEDAYLLGADVINMSLGTSCGFTYDNELESEVFGNIYETLYNAGVFVAVAAGNEASQAEGNYGLFGTNGYINTSYTDYGTVGSPATYTGNTSVAAVESMNYIAYGLQLGELTFLFSDNNTGFMKNLGGDSYSYVVIPRIGEAGDYAGIDVNGKIAVVSRGEINFSEKLTNAYNAGAVAMICYNNNGTEELVNMTIEEPEIPCIFVGTKARDAFIGQPTGTITLELHALPTENENGGLMCDFSSWGCTPDLKLNPQIAAYGGHITSASIDGNDAYTVMSGTSMAAPCLAGFYASSLSDMYEITKNDTAVMTRSGYMSEIMARMQSNASPLSDANDYLYSPRLQGTGLADPNATMTYDVFLRNPILELGDDPECTGEYELSFDVVNHCNETIYLAGAHLYAMIDYASDHNEVWYNTMTSDYLVDEDISTGNIEIEAGKTGTFTYTLTLTEEQKAQLDTQFANGTFVEGYVYLLFKNFTHERVSSDNLHGTFLAYYGDWEQAPILETNDYVDEMEAYYILYKEECTFAKPYSDGTYPTYAECGFSLYDILDTIVGYNECYGTCTNPTMLSDGMDVCTLGDNMYDYVNPNPARNALSNPNGTAGDNYLVGAVTMYPSMLRNARHLIMTVTNHDTGEVYYIDDTEYARKNTMNSETMQFMQNTYFYWDGTDANGNYLPNGTNVDLTYTANLDYNDMEPRQEWLIQLVIDNEAPVINNVIYDEATNEVTFTVSDDRYLSYVCVYDAVTNAEIFGTVFEDETLGASHEVTVSLDALSEGNDQFIIDVNDYATNYADETYEIRNIPEKEWDCPFTDVDLNAWYADSVEYNVRYGIFKGTDSTHFDPDGQMTRAMAVQVLYMLSGNGDMSEEAWGEYLSTAAYENPYTDLVEGEWYTRAVQWATITGVVSGDGNGHFMPTQPIDRQQLAVMALNFCTYMEGLVDTRADLSGYADADEIAVWAADAMSWMVGQGLLYGTGNNCISPTMGASRAQCCAVIERYFTIAGGSAS